MIIGRQKEIAVLKDSLQADNSQFIAVYGRRRVGKTFLIREAFGGKFTFQHSGIANESRANQLMEWKISLEKYLREIQTYNFSKPNLQKKGR